MLELSPQERRALRAKAHHLHPVVSIGQHGLTPKVLHEIDVALAAHALVKVRVHSDDRREREAMLARIAEELESAPVQHLGKLLILWRPLQESQPPAGKPATRPGKKAAKRSGRARSAKPPGLPVSGQRESRALQPTARRARGAGASASARRHAADESSPFERRRRGTTGTSSASNVRGAGGPEGLRPPRSGIKAHPSARDGARGARGTGVPAPRGSATRPAVNPRRRRRAG
jgi:putative YhbY family RNA-binding protein